ncbi:tetratricopeptide repeat protein [Hyalangium rubrum]|uniref:Tetratricopeptide repeat protein n=1 Tax=Hyalangium rubrum TaxID=3103134 RepID=A0ABU5GWB2_9BACT|nr:tetratricopeptide repeat protein [Hyalangium sp. s54d21]MDY7225331.1 tetratricopeptide repeat protein [Hyalangium sp. s54d21]
MRSSPPPSARVLLVLLSVLAASALPGLAQAKDTDSNALGFKAYEKGDYKKAHGLFEKALKQNPDNAYARLNRARTITLLNQSKDKVDSAESCDYASNWMFRALADLSKAVELNRAAILPKIDEDEKGLKPLKAREDYVKWRKAVGALAGEAGGTEKVLRETSDWWFHAPGAIPVGITLHPDKKISELSPAGEEQPAGQWGLKGEQLEFTPPKGKPVHWKVSTEKYYFNEGKDFFFELQLVPANAELPASGWLAGPLRAGPITGDCE